MNGKVACSFLILSAVLFAAAPVSVLADDSAASIAAGGLVSRRETRIVMAKEVLRIGLKRVEVDYDFRNDTAEDVTTEVAFPVPDYGYSPDSSSFRVASFSGFRLLVNGASVAFQVETKAKLEGKDVTATLLADKIDVASFGHLDEPSGTRSVNLIPDLARLPKAEQKRLVTLGLFDAVADDNPSAMWMVHLQYHWTQRFPAHSTTHIRHEYSPVAGSELLPLKALQLALQGTKQGASAHSDETVQDAVAQLESLCADVDFLRTAARGVEAGDPQLGQFAYPQWVDFILTSANTWQRPIEDFTLIIERGAPEQGGKRLISFCSPANGKVEKLDAGHFQVHLADFVPTAELHIGFVDLPAAKTARPEGKR